jgi:undecaprenyl-phosphate 4-deoxy-4-formamido-L-arabinose transferase
MNKLDVIIPVYNSERSVGSIIQELVDSQELRKFEYKVLLVNDGSTDRSLEICRSFAASNPQIIVIDLMRNYGQHAAIFAGIFHSHADLIVTMDDDGQHLVSEIKVLIEKMNNEFDVVYGIPNKGEHGILRNAASAFFKSVLFRTLGIKDSRQTSAFRLVRKQVLNGLDFSSMSTGILDVAIHWNTSRIGWTKVEMRKRTFGKSSYSFFRLVKLGLGMLTSYSIRPLKLATIIGLSGFVLSSVFAAGILILNLMGKISVPGFTTIAILVSILSSVQLVTLGILGEYIGNIHQRSISKPTYTVRTIWGDYDT